MTIRKSIGKDQAVKMFRLEWWVGKRYRDIALIGLSLQELTLPLTILHLAVENSLKRPVDFAEVKDESESLLLKMLGGFPPLTLAQIHDIAFPGGESEISF